MPNTDTNELSEREQEILKLIATGVSNKEIANKLFISSNTVKVHLRNIFAKIGATSRTEAAMYAVRIGLVETASPIILSDEDVLQSSINQQLPFDSSTTLPTNSLNPRINIKRSVLYVSIFGFIIILFSIYAIVYLRQNNNPIDTLVSPTSTPRVQWFELPGLPIPRQGLAVINYDNQIYAIGGENAQGISNVVERFNPQANTWIDLAPKPTMVTEINAAAIGGLIYVPGGKLVSGLPTDITEIYDPQSNEWSTGISLPKPLSAYALTVFEGRIYIFGGWDGKQVVNDAYVFDYHNNTWTNLPPMPTARSFAGAVVVGGKIYVIGGWDGQEGLTTNEVYQPDFSGQGSQWLQAPPLPSGRYGMGVTNLANIIFIIGGTKSDNNLTTIALIPEETDWVKIENPLQIGWSFLGATTVGTRLYVLGGKTEEGFSNQMWSYQAIFTISLPIVR